MAMKFKEYQGLELPEIAKEILGYWQSENIFQKSIDHRPENKPFVFYEGPPSANGLPGVHHVLARAIKDIFPRYKTMKGYRVQRKAGWDTHGLPVELGVEKELGISKEDIGNSISIEAYNAACRAAVMKYTDVWNDLTEKMGYWVDMDDPYVTYQPKYMESVWWLLKQIYNKNLLYKGYTIQPYSPKAGTGLSSHELNQPGTYQDVTDTTVTAQFKAIDDTLPDILKGDLPLYFLAWTTTPWTLPSNTALTVGPKIEYVVVSTYNQYTFEPMRVVLAKALVSKQFTGVYEAAESLDGYHSEKKKIPFVIGESIKGVDLLEIKYEQLLQYALPFNNPKNAFRVIAGDFVTTEDGTGIVHTAPTFGADDALVAKQATPEIPPMLVKDEQDRLVPLVDLQGRFRPEVVDFAGYFVKNEYYPAGESPDKSVDVEIAIKLKTENKAFKVEKYKHSYPNCWRTDKPILYYPLDSWFIKATEVKLRMAELNNTINWKPKSTGEGRFGNWLANANDWNLSRSRYWGIPLPIWRTEDGKEEKCIGSVEELIQEIETAMAAGLMDNNPFEKFVLGDQSDANYEHIDLHKNIVDGIVLCSSKGEPMHRESDLIDVWFDSGAMPYAQWHYPFENKDKIDDGAAFPADFIAEGVDQTRGWFYTLHAISTLVFDKIAYKNVVSNGLVLDKNGQKMSKRLGNAIDPFETIETHGPDATRWYMISNANPWDNLKFDLDGITEIRRKFFGTLYNTYSFFALYANVDGFNYKEDDILVEERPELDRWILSELQNLIAEVDQFYAAYEPTKAARAISDFTQDSLSNWYVRLSRRRFWKGSYESDKISAYQTLHTCLVAIAKLGAPIAPFYMDQLYKDLMKVSQKEAHQSVHLAAFPVPYMDMVDEVLNRKMGLAKSISSLTLSLRAKEKIKVRQPLQKIMVPVLNNQQKNEILTVANLIKSEVNVKEIELITETSDILVKQIKPNYKTLGPRFGQEMKAVAAMIQQLDAKAIASIEHNGSLPVIVNEKNITLERSDVEISSQDIEGWLVASDGENTVALDITISEALRNEGVARELVNRIQNLRKDSGYEVTDRISIRLSDDPSLKLAIEAHGQYIKEETLADELQMVPSLEQGIELSFDNILSNLHIFKN